MKYFLDSAKIDEIRYAYRKLAIDGITTNPNHIKNSGKSCYEICEELAKEFAHVDLPISIEIDPHLVVAEDMIKAGREYAAMSKNFVIKIPCTMQGLIAAKALEAEGIRTNVTLVFTVSQALQVGRLHCSYVSPFVGWKENNGEDGITYLGEIADIYRRYDLPTQIIAAAIRNGRQIGDAALQGIDIVTAGLSVYEESMISPYTDLGIQKFCKAWEESEK